MPKRPLLINVIIEVKEEDSLPNGPQETSLIERSLSDYFSVLLEDAAQNQHYPLSPLTKSYVTQVLVSFHETAKLFFQAGVRVPVLADILSEALEADLYRRIILLQQMGDTSLMVSGFFPEALNRRSVNLDYYQRMGELAYNQLHALREPQNIFRELSHEFSRLSLLINEISENTQGKSASTLRLLEMYLETGSQRALDRLRGVGVIPIQRRR